MIIALEGTPDSANAADRQSIMRRIQNAMKQYKQGSSLGGTSPFWLTVKEQSLLLQLASDAILGMDLDGNIVFWNDGASRLYGYHEAEAMGMCARELLETEFPCPLNEIVESVKLKGEWRGVLRHKNKSEDAVWVASRWIDRRNPEGEVIGVFEINRDITAQRRATGDLSESEKWASLGRFAATLSHEIRNPLDAALGAAFLLHQNNTVGTEAVSYVKIISSQLQQIKEITSSTLNFYRDLRDVHTIDLCELVEETCHNLRHMSLFSNVELRVRCNRECAVRAVPTDIRQLVTNLALNAAQATEAGGQVRVTVSRPSDSEVKLNVSNSGSYITSDLRRQLFDPSFTTKRTGHGLGLWIVSTFVRRLGGSINVRSWRSGFRSSTTFGVRMPYARAPRRSEAA